MRAVMVLARLRLEATRIEDAAKVTNAQAYPRPSVAGLTALNRAAGFWLIMALIGQWLFLAYILAFYGPIAVTGDLAGLARHPMMPKGHEAGDLAGNLTLLSHALAASIVAFGGGLQLMPQIRNRFPTFHRWNGRIFLVVVTLLSLGGLYLVWVRGTEAKLSQDIAITGNAAAILGFAFLAYRTARARDFVSHRRWALRLYLVSNAQWFTRVGVTAWYMGHKIAGVKPVPGFFDFWVWGCYLVPLAVLEVYLQAKDRGSPAGRWGATVLLGVVTVLMILGTIGFSIGSVMILQGKAFL